MRREGNSLRQAFESGDRRALAEMISLVELGQSPAMAPPSPGAPALRIGITGSGGAGKSTLVAALATHLRRLGLRVAVVACDPQSPLTGGALLGDRVRVPIDPEDAGFYFRSLSTRGAAGGVSAAVPAILDWLDAFGFDVILVETVGVGQDQIAVRAMVDTLVLLVTPNTGDEVQWEKAGLIEVADLLVVNKADLPGADRVRQQLVSALSLSPAAEVAPVLATVAARGTGVPELWEAMSAHSRAVRAKK